MTKRRGNPNWGRTPDHTTPMPVSLCGWDLLLYSLKLSPSDALGNPRVREYVNKHHRNRFIPEKVLEHFQIDGSFFD